MWMSIRSFTPAHSIGSPRSIAARNAARPVRPKPLIPTRTDMLPPVVSAMLRPPAGRPEPGSPPVAGAGNYGQRRAPRPISVGAVDAAVIDVAALDDLVGALRVRG